MKRVLTLFLSLSVLLLAACSKVPAGNVGVKFQMYGDDKGSLQELPPGRYWVGWGYEMYTFPTFTQTYTFTRSAAEGRPVDESISFQTSQGLTVNADVGITYHIDPSRVTLIFQKYRKGIDEITDVYLRNMVRDALVKEAASLDIESVYGKGKANLIEAVQRDVREEVGSVGIVVEKIYWIGELRLPENVVQSINAKIQATQMAEQRQNEVAQAQAEAQKVEAEAQGQAQARITIAAAEAKAIALKGEALRQNPNVVQMSAIEKWDGRLPTYSGGALPFLHINAPDSSK
ncbi:prohibitin family protein [Dyella jiangningensis]|uniref:Transposase n=1 Tax=Dyella jiangningensis TaxID=1379159 RepID=A0A328P4R5_9GAMM|nr:prohibitin family protein [Dyella jiangningensis]RAO76610.1 transposase [Dyella jiangningensis]